MSDNSQFARTTLDAASAPIMIFDPDGLIRYCNPACEQLTGYSLAEVEGRSIFDGFMSSEASSMVQGAFETLQTEGRSQTIHVMWVTQDNHHRHLVWDFGGTFDTDGTLQTVVGYAVDRSEQVAMAEKLAESQRRYDVIVQTMSDALSLHAMHMQDEAGRITFVNEKFCDLLGYSRRELLQHPLTDLLDETNTAIYERHTTGRTRGETRSDEIVFTHRDGHPVWTILSSVPLYDPTRPTQGSVGVITNVTELKQVESALRESNQELDAFAHTVAHDLKSPLTVIVGFADVLAENFATLPTEDVREYVTSIKQYGHKMTSIIEEMLLLAELRNEQVEHELLDMADIMDEVYRRLDYMIEESRATFVVTETWPAATGYAPWVEEIWANYIINAMKYGGDPPHVELGADDPVDGMVRFWVRDNGQGLTPEQQARLFTAFERLDQTGVEGSGLGLTIVLRIVNKLGGEVGIESEVGSGSLFSFTLPAAD